MRLDSDYHKALKNRGLLMQAEGAELYVKRTDDARARQLLQDATGLFARAKVLKSVAEYHHNYGRGAPATAPVDRRLQRGAAGRRQGDEQVPEPARRRWWHRRPGVDQERYRAEREGFKRSVQLALAISWVLARELDGQTMPALEEQAALADVFKAFAAKSRVPSHPKLEYNLACYYAVMKDLKQAVPLFLTLRAVTPDLAKTVLADPDLADIPEIIALFTSQTLAVPAVGRPSPPGADDEPDRDAPT